MFFLWFLILDTNIVDKLLLSHFSVLLAVERLFRRSETAEIVLVSIMSGVTVIRLPFGDTTNPFAILFPRTFPFIYDGKRDMNRAREIFLIIFIFIRPSVTDARGLLLIPPPQ